MTTELRDRRRSSFGRVFKIRQCTTRHLALAVTPERRSEQHGRQDLYANRFARDPQGASPQRPQRMNALKPIMRFQVSMLRMWADSIERFAGNYEKGLDETATALEEQSDKERAA